MDQFSKFFTEQNSVIPNSEHLPAYKVLEMVILAGIEKGIWKEGDLLPPERHLAQLCGYSVGTVKRAMLELGHQGLLYRRRGIGTFVSGTSFTRQNRRYYLFLRDFGAAESKNAVKLLSVNKIPPIPGINAQLGLREDAELFEMVRLFNEDNTNCVLCKSYLCAERFAGLDAISAARLEHVPFYLVLEDDYEVSSVRSEELFGAVASQQEESKILDIALGTPLLMIKSLTYSHNDKPFEYRISLCFTENKYIYRAMG